MNLPATIFLVDDEPGMLRALSRLLEEEGFAVICFESASEFLACDIHEKGACLLLDIHMPGLDGMELQQRLLARAPLLPIVFLTGHGDIPMSVRAIKSGAVDFLTKPVKDETLLRAIKTALSIAERRLEERDTIARLQERFATLTPREREVMSHVITGKLNKQIASDLGTGLQTIKIHRMRVMGKMGLESVAELVRAAERLGVNPGPSLA